MLVAFDGIDGSGKSTQIELLIKFLEEKKINYYFFDMGGFGVTKKYLYNLKHHIYNCSPELRELLYYFEGHLFSDFYRDLDRETVVICDRWLLTYFSYGQFNGIELDDLKELLKKLVRPDLYFYMDVPVETAMKRIKKYRKFDGPEIGLKNKLSEDESENIKNFLSSQNKIHNYFEKTIKEIDCGIIKIDATQEKQQIHELIREKVWNKIV